MKLVNNYHTHTKRCGHAVGNDEDYVLKAIELGIKELGFSDHIPFPNVIQKGVRMDYEEIDEYIASINALKEKYKDKIKIYVGFEAEYYHEIKDYYLSLLQRVDYLICGQHFARLENEQVYVGFERNNQAMALDYVTRVVEAIESGLFKYIAHPDLIFRSYTIQDEFREKLMRMICEAAERKHIPLEINLEGMRRKVYMGDPYKENFYPFLSFWKIVSEYDIDVIIGADVHEPSHLDGDYDKYAFEIVKMYNLHLIDKLDFSEKSIL